MWERSLPAKKAARCRIRRYYRLVPYTEGTYDSGPNVGAELAREEGGSVPDQAGLATIR